MIIGEEKIMFLNALYDTMKLEGLTDFWVNHYTPEERLEIAEVLIKLAVVQVEFHKKFSERNI